MPTTPRRQRPPKVEGWVSQLDGGRVEIFLKVERFDGAADYKIRSSGPEADMMELVDFFERKTGLRVEVPHMQRARRGPKPIDGQTMLLMGDRPDDTPDDDGTRQLSSGATVGDDG